MLIAGGADLNFFMQLFITFLTVVLVLNCMLLMLLVLIQLPKKEAGAGLAFGGGATDALFGAGSGNVLTKATKYAGIAFFALAVVLSILETYRSNHTSSEFAEKFKQHQNEVPAITAPPTPPAAPAQTA